MLCLPAGKMSDLRPGSVATRKCHTLHMPMTPHTSSHVNEFRKHTFYCKMV